MRLSRRPAHFRNVKYKNTLNVHYPQHHHVFAAFCSIVLHLLKLCSLYVCLWSKVLGDTDCRLRGALRRLDVPDALEFDEAEYAEAADAVFQAAQDIADESRWGSQDMIALKKSYPSPPN